MSSPSFERANIVAGQSKITSERIILGKKYKHFYNLHYIRFSKGGIDARVYLQGGTDDVANLIMIGTPKAGSPLAEMYNDVGCMPAATDLRPGSSATRPRENMNTDYHTISGDWRYWYFWMLVEGNLEIEGPDDGWVPVSSVESLRYSDTLGQTSSYHTDLLGSEEYGLARDSFSEVAT